MNVKQSFILSLVIICINLFHLLLFSVRNIHPDVKIVFVFSCDDRIVNNLLSLNFL